MFVAGVSWNTSDEAFSGFFSAFGVVKEAIVMREQNGRSRGFGFVTYEAHSSVDKVLSQQLQLDGRKLDIKPAVSKEEMLSTQAKPTTKKLYVAGVDYSTSDDALFNFFARFGEIEKAMIMKDKATGRSRGFGFVTFARENSVEEAVAAGASSALQLEGRALDVKAAFPRGSAALMPGYQANNTNNPGQFRSKKIFVAGLLPSTTDDSLRAYFENHGKVTDCYVQKNRTTNESRGFGFVQFETEGEVSSVIKKEHMVDGKSVDVKVATPRPSQNTPNFMDYQNGGGMPYQHMMPGMYGGYGGRGGGRGGGYNGMQPMPSGMQQRGGGQGGGQGNAMAQGAMGMGMGMNAGMQGAAAAMAMNAGNAMAMGVPAQQGGMAGQQYVAGSQQGGNFGGEARYAGAYQPQGNVYSQTNANAGFEVAEGDFGNGGNPYGSAGSYGAYGGRGGARSRNFHPYSR